MESVQRPDQKAVILLSGGLDSLTCLALAKSEGYTCYAISFNYGQRHATELKAAQTIAEIYAVAEHQIVELPLTSLIKSTLMDKNAVLPSFQDFKVTQQIPNTYVPARNIIFLSVALGYAETLGAHTIFYGASHVDYSGYMDCRPEFVDAFQNVINTGTKAGANGATIQIRTPLIDLSKRETIQLGLQLGVDYGASISCYQANAAGEACGICDPCGLRARGFAEAQVTDPTRYFNSVESYA